MGMSYRDDLEAALARVDDLEHELGLARKAAAAAPKEHTPAIAARNHSWVYLLVGALAVTGMGILAFATGMPGHKGPSPSEAPAPAPELIEQPPPIRLSHVATCAEMLRPSLPSSAGCLADLDTAIEDNGLGADVHLVLARWRDLERGNLLAERDQMLDEIHAVIVPSFTR